MDMSDWMYLLREHGGTLLTVLILLLLVRWFGKLLAENQTVADTRDSSGTRPLGGEHR